MPLDQRILVLHTFGNQNWRALMFIKIDTLLDSKTDACEIHTHFSTQHNSVCKHIQSWRHVGFSFCLNYVLGSNFLYNRLYFLEDTSFCQSYWSGFIWCMGKCFSYQDTWFWWCLKKNFLHNILLLILFFFCVILPNNCQL